MDIHEYSDLPMQSWNISFEIFDIDLNFHGYSWIIGVGEVCGTIAGQKCPMLEVEKWHFRTLWGVVCWGWWGHHYWRISGEIISLGMEHQR